jgi:SecD/SecF fusion protein
MKRLIGHTKIDFMGWFPYCLTASVLITIMAIVVSFYRGQGLFDIDFTGGTSVQAQFTEPQDTGRVRKLLAGKLDDLAVSDVRIAGEKEGLRFDINTSERDLQKVKKQLSAVFGDTLARNVVNATEPKLIEGAAKEAPPAEKQPKANPAKPEEKKQSRNELPASTMLAMAGSDSMALALADEPPKASPDKPIVSQPASNEKPAELSQPKSALRKASPVEPLADKAAAEAAPKPAAAPDPFAGGSLVQLKFKLPVNYQAVDQLVISAMEAMQIVPQSIAFQMSNPRYVEGDQMAYKEWDLKIMLSPERTKELLGKLEHQVADNPVFPSSSNIGAAVAGNTQLVAIYALIASWMGIILYLWVRFQGVAFGLAAVIGLIHDVFVMLGAIAVSIYIAPFLGFLMVEPFKINLPIVAAFLTIIGYSVNDTIVVFDRIREVRGKDPDLTRQMVNDSTNQTLSRTLLTSVTVFLVVVVLYFFGGDAIHGFAFALLVGVITGTYSSIYVSAPILLWLVGKHGKKVAA